MRNMKWIAALLVCVMCLGLFAGCKQNQDPQGTTTVPTTQAPTTEPTAEPTTVPTEPPMDAETLIEKMGGEEDPYPTGMEFLLELGVTMNMPEYGMSMGVAGEASGEFVFALEPFALYAEAELVLDYMGQKEIVDLVVYGMPEGEQNVFYIGMPEMETWLKLYEEDLGLASDESGDETPEDSNEIQWSEVLLQEELADYNGMACYVLTVKPDVAQAMADVIEDMSLEEDIQEQMPEIAELDWSVLQMPFTFYVEESTLLLRSLTIDLQGIGELISALMTSMEVEEQAQTAIDVPTFHFELTNITYDPVEVPQISEEDRLEADAQNYRAKQEDGSYLFKGETSDYRVVLPQGWTMDSSDKTNFTISCLGKQTEGYILYVYASGEIVEDGTTLETYISEMVDMYTIFYETGVTSGTAEIANGYPVMWYSYEGMYSYVLQVPGGDGYLRVEFSSYDLEDPYAYIQQIAEGIEAVEPT